MARAHRRHTVLAALAQLAPVLWIPARSVALAVALTGAAVGGAAGAQSMVFTHVATAANTAGSFTFLQPRAYGLAFFTQDWNPPGSPGVYNDHPICVASVVDDHGNARWLVGNADGAPIPLGAAFTVWVGRPPFIAPADNTSFVHFATAGNTDGHTSTVDHPALNDNREAAPIFVAYCGGPTVEMVLFFDGSRGRWTLGTPDGSAIPIGAAFFICVGNCGSMLPASGGRHTCTAELIVHNVCYLDPPLTRAHRLLAVHGGGGYRYLGPIGVWWDSVTAGQAVFLQRFQEEVTPTMRFSVRWTLGGFESGFETADFTGWSAAVP